MNRLVSVKLQRETYSNYLSRHLGQQELRRRLWHFLPGFIALALATVPHRETVRLWIMLFIVAFGIFLPAMAAVYYQRAFRRSRDEDIAPSIFGYVLPLSILCLLFRSNVEIPLAVASIIAFGDGSATLVGLLTKGPRIPWNHQKSINGMLAFMFCGSLLASTVYWIAASPDVDFASSLLCVAPVAVICGILETLPFKLNDNITIGCAAAFLMVVMQNLTIGWM